MSFGAIAVECLSNGAQWQSLAIQQLAHLVKKQLSEYSRLLLYYLTHYG
jgi:hypothetical protein